MPITPLPTPPSRDDSANFASRADSFLAALPTFATEANATATEVNDNALSAAASALSASNSAAMTTIAGTGITGTSTTSLTIGTGSRSLTIETGKTFVAGMSVRIGSTSAPNTNFMDGTVTSYNPGTGDLVVNVLSIGGSGTFTSWTVRVYQDLPEIRTPLNVSPASGATNNNGTPVLTGSTYLSLYGVAMTAAQWQVSTVSTFASTVVNTGDVAGASVTYTIASGVLSVSTTYFWRVRYKDQDGVYSDWSTPTSFTTASVFTDYIPTPAATPSNFGDSFEGGFYAGLVWNEVTQSSTGTTIGTGSRTFTVTDAAPLFYSGQTVEVRSRANPATNWMIGTVTFSLGTTLTINVTSVNGSGTLTDWSVMARYRVIVAPKSSGENSSIQWKNTNTAGPSATGTLSEGWRATEAMRTADTSAVYPLAHWARNLSINGRTDWYVPARDELELCWRNLKPTTDNNYTTADRPTGATPNYQNLGAIGDTSASHGVNNNSSPQGTAYTTTVPGRVTNSSFHTGGAEAFTYGGVYFWSSTEYSASIAWHQRWTTGDPGNQNDSNKNDTNRARAVRRSII